MLDISDQLVEQYHAHRLPGLDLGKELLAPYYDGGSVLNLTATICDLFGIPWLGEQPVMPALMNPLKDLGGDVDRVVMVLVDGLSLHRFKRWMSEGKAPGWVPLANDGFLGALTSIFPSTTSAAIPTIWSGLSPAQHGMVGYELFMKEFGLVANMITHSPFSIPGSTGSLERAGFKPEKALPGVTLGSHLAAHGIKPFAFQHYSIAHSGMSRMFMQDVEIKTYGGASELWVTLRQLLEQTTDKKAFFWIYWSQVDSLSHTFGPDDEQPESDFTHFSQAFERFFLDKLSPDKAGKTLLLMAADHGQITTSKDPFYDLRYHPQLIRRLHFTPTGENRAAYFYIRPGQFEAVREWLDRIYFERFIQLDPLYAIEKGLFGPGRPSDRLYERVGDLLALAQGDAFLWWGEKPNPIIGRHGGLSPDEMLVPMFAVRL